jgi:hypothetical protein
LWAEITKKEFNIEPDRDGRWQVIVWRFEVTFPNGCKLAAFESHSRKKDGHYRKLKYRLMEADGTLIFMIDTHQTSVPFNEAPHFHKGPSEDLRLHDGSWELNNYSLLDYDFLKMWALVEGYLKDGSVPWRQ